jgi:DNA-binding response OmpR family regulator
MSAETATPAAARTKRTILVVDDEPPIRELLRVLLEMHGHRILTADDAEEALRVIGPDEPLDLVITDLKLPGISGNDLVRQLLPGRPGLHVLYISGSPGGATGLTAPPGGKMRYLPKPFAPRDLLGAVRSLLEG